MKLKNEKTYYEIKGLNFNKFLLALKKNNVEVFSLKRQSYNVFFVEIRLADKPVFDKLVKSMNYEVKPLKSTMALSVKNGIQRHVAMAIAIVLLFVSLVISSNVVYKIEVLGLENLTYQEVVGVLDKNNIKTPGFRSSYNLREISLVLKRDLSAVSLASAVIKGNTLIVNVNEKIERHTHDYAPIIAPFDCIIKEINLISGTAVASVGSTVKKGGAIVDPYITYKDGTRLNVKADAQITAYVELSTSKTYQENHTEQLRTGNKMDTWELSLFGKNLGKGGRVKFEKFEIEEEKSFVFAGLILPIVKTTTTCYELCEKQVFVPIENVLQNMIVENKKVLYNSLSYSILDEISDHTTLVKQNDDSFLVTTYLKATIEF